MQAKNSRQDIKNINATLSRLLMPTWVRQGITIVLAIVIWYWISTTILQLGVRISYDGLKSLGPEVVKILNVVNPYLWWGVVAIVSLIILSLLRGWLLKSTKRSKSILVPVADVQRLTAQLSVDALEVLKWVWDETADPLMVGDLQATRRELKSGRVRKLAMAKAQINAIDEALANAAAASHVHHGNPDAEPDWRNPNPLSLQENMNRRGTQRNEPSL